MVLTVDDSGPGIAEAEREHVFERFYASWAPQAEGSGLGLAIVREVVEGAGGTVTLGTSRWAGCRWRCDCRSRSEEMRMNRRILITGCSGGGKSTLLAELAARGFSVVEEPGRRIVREELESRGDALPWVNLAAFAQRAIALSIEDHAAASQGAAGRFSTGPCGRRCRPSACNRRTAPGRPAGRPSLSQPGLSDAAMAGDL